MEGARAGRNRARRWGGPLRRVAPVLRQAGIPVKRAQRTSRTRTIIIEGVKRPKERTEFDD